MISSEAFDALASRCAVLFARVEARGLASLTEAERVLVVVWGTSGEIENGGFDQFFYNSSGDYAIDAPAAFRAIGAARHAELIERALTFFPNASPPRSRAERTTALEQIVQREGESVFDELDNAFYVLPEKIDALLAAYVAAHDAEIARTDTVT